jgi:2-polyprenyl-6-methoxyphenol hydroxylase-like FAD-dependent oxidoreductase
MAAEAARFGLTYRIIDKSPHGALHSQALLLQPRTLEQFERYELAQRAIELGRRLYRIRIYGEGNRIVESSFDELRGNYPFLLLLPQPETERLLNEHLQAQGGMIEREIALEYFEEREDSVECVLLGRTGARDTVSASYLIGADGAQSTVRGVLGIPFEPRGTRFDALIGDLRADGDAPDDELVVHLHGGSVVFIGRIDDTHCRFLVAPKTATEEPRLQDFQSAIDEAGIENLRVSDPRWMTVLPMSEHHAAVYARGRIFLGGDAAAVHSHMGGQGLNAGIADAENLLWKIACVLRGRGGRLLLDSYDAERAPVSAAVEREAPMAIRAILENIQQLQLSYRNSPIVRDCGVTGGLRAGDRAVDCEVVDETGKRLRLFDCFKEPVHTALLVMPPPGAPLERFAEITHAHAGIVQAMVLVSGGADLQTYYGTASLYVVRPDGYVGFRGSAADVDALRAWLEKSFS